MKRLTGLLALVMLAMCFLISCDKEKEKEKEKEEEGVQTFGSVSNGLIVATDEATDVSALYATLNALVEKDRPEGSLYWFFVSTEETSAEKIVNSYRSRIIFAEKDGTKFSATATFLDYGQTHYYVAGTTTPSDERIYANEVKTFTPRLSDGPAVDMGLSVKWASCNVGASRPYDYGEHYQWGGTKDVTKPSSKLSWSNCPFHSGSDYKSGWTKYMLKNFSSYWSGSGSPDDKSVLDKADDIANKKLGGKWRMPTREEFKELVDNSTRVWKSLNGVNGCFYTSTKEGYKDKCIFLPAAGFVMEKTLGNDDMTGYYWSSSLYTDMPQTAYLLTVSQSPGDGNLRRYYGLSVRPVQTK